MQNPNNEPKTPYEQQGFTAVPSAGAPQGGAE